MNEEIKDGIVITANGTNSWPFETHIFHSKTFQNICNSMVDRNPIRTPNKPLGFTTLKQLYYNTNLDI